MKPPSVQVFPNPVWLQSKLAHLVGFEAKTIEEKKTLMALETAPPPLDSVTVSLFVLYIWFDNQVLLWDEQACLDKDSD